MKTLVLVAGLFLFGINVNAQDFWKGTKADNNFNESAMAMAKSNFKTSTNVVNSAVSTDANVIASYLQAETEEAMELENWMTDENYFVNTFDFVEETENPLELESRMTDENYFEVNLSYLEVETEEELELEEWMVDEAHWK